jgi:hypothetical protein
MSVTAQGDPTSYNCVINEYQRQFLVKALTCYLGQNEQFLSMEPGEILDSAYEELQMLMICMFNMRGDERETPNVTHGLCL